MRPGRLLQHGNTSHLHEWGTGAVAKVLRADIPAHWAEREALTTELVRAIGLPAPTVLGLVDVDGRPGIVFERVDGPSMLEEAVRRPEQALGLGQQLAALQRLVAARTAPAALPRLRDRLAANLARAELAGPVRTAVQARLASLPSGTAVCHFDLHPGNVLLGPGGPVLIDWFDAAAGDPHADVVRTATLLHAGFGDGHLASAPAPVLAALLTGYLGALEPDVAADPGWEPVVRAARVAEPVGAAAHEALRAAVHAALRREPGATQGRATERGTPGVRPASPSARAR
ncbi:phosphotransferase family protein [Aquipuribacter sp. SD81]|uniref:phosphotransferase family protein n=1 Tax=Aquipuribacter sp. SD81 TaxID=3127703 RepID=UPI00301A92AE